ncbi:MAG: toll/interleukin-1 receptor domain-containing protein [Alphaproteobacteria bacterium]|nr:MAG: toll/interleukin-1 receptor domain-containing protein [Alphaproteobacteria bacterium]
MPVTPSASFDIFLSYRTDAAEPVKRLKAALEAQGLQVFLDSEDIQDFDHITERLKRGVLAAKAMVVWYTPDYPDSRPCQWELTLALRAQRVLSGDRLLVIADQDMIKDLQPASLKDRRAADLAEATKDPTAVAAKIAAKVRGLDQVFGQAVRIAPKQWFRTPLTPRPGFVGRVRDLWAVDALLQKNQTVGVVSDAGAARAHVQGLGGMGKSALAHEYACRFAADFPGGIFWLSGGGDTAAGPVTDPAVGEQRRFAELQAIASHLGVGDEITSEDEAIGRLKRVLSRSEDAYLWVIDDLPGTTTAPALKHWVAPTPNGRTLILSRNRTLLDRKTTHTLDKLPRPDSIALLRTGALPTTSDEALNTLAEAVGDFPLALSLLAKRLADGFSPAGLAATITATTPMAELEKIAAAIGEHLPDEHISSIARTFASSFDQLGAGPSDAKALLAVTGMLGAAPIPFDLARAALPDADIDSAVQVLIRHGLIDPTGTIEEFRVHPLLAAAAAAMGWLPQEESENSGGRVMAWFQEAIKALELTPADKIKLEPYLPHLEAMTRDPKFVSDTLERIALFHYYAGHIASAAIAWRAVVSNAKDTLGPEHPNTQTFTNNLASTLRGQGDLNGARTLHDQVLAILRRILGPEHPETLKSMGNLATTLFEQGDLNGAGTLLEEVLDIQRRTLGPEHPDTLISMNNLASILAKQGDLNNARTLLEEVLAIQRRILGPEHPETLTSMNSLATTLTKQDDLDGARTLQEQVLAIRRRILGSDHPNTLVSMNNLAATLSKQGDLDSAHMRQEQVLDIQRRILGPEHINTLSSMNNLAATRYAQRNLNGARTLLDQALPIRRRNLGPDHPDTLITAVNLLRTIIALNDHDTARALVDTYLAEGLACPQADVRAAWESMAKALGLTP